MSNYQTGSHLSYLSKIVEKVISSQIVKHLNKNIMMEKFQSAYRQSHSTETSLLRFLFFFLLLILITVGGISFTGRQLLTMKNCYCILEII